MSTPPMPARLVRLTGIVMCGVALVATLACHHRTPASAPRPAGDSVSVGYETRTQEQTGRAVQSITAVELANVRVKRVEEMLAGRVAGVRVLPTPNGGFAIRIRGVSTVVGNTGPLYIVDGLPVEVTPGEGLNWLDPADITRIDVLKDPAETTMYGVRGANGVILIKTKRSGSR
jgi:TonB-dependent SusC/RagA subfamily outer membrane receptor